MAKVQVSKDGALIGEHRLTRGRITVGRRRHSEIRLESPEVSGDHALIERLGKLVYLEDRDSTNGTRLNGKVIKRKALQFGDEIAIGAYLLRYVDDKEPSQPSFEKTLMKVEHRMGGNSVDTRPTGETTLTDLNALHAHGVLRLVSGPNAGRELKLEKQVTTLGKPGVQVAVVARREHSYFLSRVEGTAGPQLNGGAVDDKPHPLRAGDRVELMGVTMIFEMHRQAEPKPTGV